MLRGFEIHPPTQSYRDLVKPANRDSLFFALTSPGFAIPTLPAKDNAWYRPQRTLTQSRPSVTLGINGEPLDDVVELRPPRSLFYSPRQTYIMDFGAPATTAPDPQTGAATGAQAQQVAWQDTSMRQRAARVRSEAADLAQRHFGSATSYVYSGGDTHGAVAPKRGDGIGTNGSGSTVAAAQQYSAHDLQSPEAQCQLRQALALQTPLEPYVAETADAIQVGNVNMASLGMAVPVLDLEPLGIQAAHALALEQQRARDAERAQDAAAVADLAANEAAMQQLQRHSPPHQTIVARSGDDDDGNGNGNGKRGDVFDTVASQMRGGVAAVRDGASEAATAIRGRWNGKQGTRKKQQQQKQNPERDWLFWMVLLSPLFLVFLLAVLSSQ